MLQRYYTPNLAASALLSPDPPSEEMGATDRRAPGLSPTPSFAHSGENRLEIIIHDDAYQRQMGFPPAIKRSSWPMN